MTLRHFMSAIRSVYQTRAVLALAGSTGLLAATAYSAAADEESLATNVGSFQIPFDIETEPGAPAQGFAVLFGSQDGGARWEQLQSVPVSQDAFMFAAPRDGRYAFAIRMTDARGNVQPPASNTPPELEVVVDTVAPELKVELFESAPGQVVVNWTCNDAGASPESLTVEYMDGADGRWKPVRTQAAISGQTIVPSTAGSVLAVRASITDFAGNRGEANARLISRGASSTSAPAPASPPVRGSFQTAPLGPSPFRGSPNQIAPAAQPVSAVPSAMNENVPAMPMMPPSSPTEINMIAAQNPGLTMSLPMNPASHLPVAPAMPGSAQLVNMHVFDVDYQVDDVGPSGVSAVELFITENGGQDWFRYGTDPDLRSPFQVDAHGEGTFGFAVRVRNGLGFSDSPPQPGQAPEIVVTVDESAPVVQLSQPTVRTEGFGTLELAWRVNEANPSSAPVRLEYATSQNGPWTPVFDWQADQGGYQWAIRQGTPSSLYFRLLARDAAGNVGIGQTPQPVIVDLKKPVGRLLRVQAASHSMNPR